MNDLLGIARLELGVRTPRGIALLYDAPRSHALIFAPAPWYSALID